MDPACGVLKEYVVNPATGWLITPDGEPVARINGYVTVSPMGGFDRPDHRVCLLDSSSFQVTFPRPGNWTLEFTLEDTSGHRHTETRFVHYRPAWPEGWHEVASMPTMPSGMLVKQGGWMTRCERSGMLYAAKGYKTGDFYRYDPVGDEWTQLASLPYATHPVWGRKAPYKGAKGCSDGDNIIYATQGNNSLGFWAYYIDGDSWHRLPDVPEGPSGKRVKGGTDLVYVMHYRVPYVYLLKGYRTDFCRFNIAADSWEMLANAPDGARAKYDRGSWLVGDGMGSLFAHKAKYHELWRFDLLSGAWDPESLPALPYIGRLGRRKKLKDGGSACWSGNRLYVLKGGNTGEFWCYDIEARTWTELDTLPKLGSNDRKRRVKYGADVTSAGLGAFFTLKGNKTVELWRYVLPARTDAVRTPLPGTGLAGGGLPRIEVIPSPAAGGQVPVRYAQAREGAATISVFDAAGRLAYRVQVAGRTGTTRLDLRGLSAGVYTVRLDAAARTANAKLVLSD